MYGEEENNYNDYGLSDDSQYSDGSYNFSDSDEEALTLQSEDDVDQDDQEAITLSDVNSNIVEIGVSVVTGLGMVVYVIGFLIGILLIKIIFSGVNKNND